jgi:hypothetical protein
VAVALTQVIETAFVKGDIALATASLEEARGHIELDDGAWRPNLLELEGMLADARGDLPSARAALEESWRLFTARAEEAPQVRARLASLELRAGRLDAALAMVNPLLAEVDGDSEPAYRSLPPSAGLDCFTVLQAAGDARAGPLLEGLGQRLREQLASLGDDDDGRRMVSELPWWRTVQQLLDAR